MAARSGSRAAPRGASSASTPATDGVTQTIRLGGGDVTAIAYAAGVLWVADSTDRAIIELDPKTGASIRTISLDFHPTALAVGHGVLWVADYDAAAVSEVDLRSGETLGSALPVGNGPSAVLLAAGRLWVANSEDSTVTAIDPETDQTLATLPVGSGPTALVASSGAVWVANQYSGTVSRIDPRNVVVDQTVPVGGEPLTFAATSQTIWVGSAPSATAHRGGTLRLVSSGPWQTIDPAFQFTTSGSFTRLAYDTLVTFQATGGPAGLDLVPDLAGSRFPPPPTETPSTHSGCAPGSGIRTGAPCARTIFEGRSSANSSPEVPASAISPGSSERLAAAGDDVTSRAGSSPTTEPRPSRSTWSSPIRTSWTSSRSRVSRHRFRLGSRTTMSATTRSRAPARYRIASFAHGDVRFVRNRYFREWSHAAQPSGNPDAIIWDAAPSDAAATRDVQRDRADFTFYVSLGDLARLEVERPDQVYLNPSDLVEYISLNTHRAPFADPGVRQALNDAIDRNHIARLYGGPKIATPLCQPLAPRLPGYQRYCPYTVDQGSNGRYIGPDLDRARRLVDASGTRGEHVTVWGSPDEGTVPPQLSAYVASVLRELGYHTTVRLMRHASITPSMRRDFQIATDGDWMPDFPTPSSYLPLMFGCHGALNNGYVCDHRLDADMRRASLLEITSPAEAATAWTRIDRYLTDRAYWVPTVNLADVELVSTRLRHYEFSPTEDFLADQAWIQ